MNLAITWDVTPEIIEGYRTPNYYGLLFVTGLILGYAVIRKILKKDRIKDDYLDKLVVYMILATIVGARLGHVFFYGPYWDTFASDGVTLIERGYFSHPLDIIKVWEGGLASHGGAIVILITLYYFSKKIIKMPMLWILDRIVVAVALTGVFIRLGNLVNSEIVGAPTDVPWAFSFPHYINPDTGRLDPTPRHAAQLYEAISYLIIFFVLHFMYWKRKAFQRPGLIFGAFLVLIWGARFTIEFIKVGQAARDGQYWLNTGQMLSVPFILIGVYFIWRAMKNEPSEPEVTHLVESAA